MPLPQHRRSSLPFPWVRRHALRLAQLSLLALLISATPMTARAAELRVVASFSILADFVRQVGGEGIRLTTLVGVAGDPHVYEPTPSDAAAVAAADLVFVNGLHFEGFVPRLLRASGTRALVVEASDGAALLDAAGAAVDSAGEGPRAQGAAKAGQGGHSSHADHESHAGHESHESHAGHEGHAEHEGHAGHEGHEGHVGHAEHEGHAGHDHGPLDPHAWQSIPNARVYVANIAAGFCRVDPAGCEGYRSRARRYDDELVAVDREVRGVLDAVPADRRTVITSHDAFGYFGHEYRLSFVAPRGLSTEAEASARDVVALIRQIRASRAAAVFVESIGDPRLIEQIARETGLTVGGVLFSDALSGRDGPAPTYVDLMRHNARTIAGAALGKAAVVGSR